MTPRGLGSRLGVNLHHPETATAGDTSSPGTAKYFCLKIYIFCIFFLPDQYLIISMENAQNYFFSKSAVKLILLLIN